MMLRYPHPYLEKSTKKKLRLISKTQNKIKNYD
jgi:hypothetical protein